MRVEQEKVRAFMDYIKDPGVADKPTVQNVGLATRRRDYIVEEANEYLEAVADEDLVGIADALGDLLYVVLGLAVLHGLDARAIFDEVHRSNMTKTPMPHTPNGKLCVKEAGKFEKPRLAEIVLMQMTNSEGTL